MFNERCIVYNVTNIIKCIAVDEGRIYEDQFGVRLHGSSSTWRTY